MPYLGKSPSQGVRTRFQFTPNAGTTSISGADANGLTLSFTDGNYVDVYLNGVMLKAGVDYNTNTANTIAGLSATVASDVVDIVVYDTFSVFGGTLEGNVKVNNGTFNVTGAVDFDSTLNVDGVVTTDGATHDGDVTFTGANYNAVWDKSDNALEFGDNAKAIFGAGGDLEIYHSGSHSIIKDGGTGNLQINAGNFNVNNVANSANIIVGNDGGAVKLFYDGSNKLETTSTGVNVTGTVTADGLNVEIEDNNSGPVTIQQGGNSYFKIVTTNSSETVELGNSTTKPNILLGGGNVGIGTTSPTVPLHVDIGSDNNALYLQSSDQFCNIGLIDGSGSGKIIMDSGKLLFTTGGDSSTSFTGSSTRVTIDTSGNLGIGTTSPSAGLHIDNPNDSQITAILDTDNSAVKIVFRNNTETGNNVQIGADGSNLVALTNASERMRIDSSGDLNIVNTGQASLNFTTDGSSDYAQILGGKSGSGIGDLRFSVYSGGLSEAMRIDSSGRLLLGTTSTTLYDATSGGGILAVPNSSTTIARQSSGSTQPLLILNETGVDGTLQEFRKDGSIMGRISSTSTGVALGTPTGSGSGLHLISNAILPSTSTGGTADGLKDLGSSSSRFKDLFLSGDITFGDGHSLSANSSNGNLQLVSKANENIVIKANYSGGVIVFEDSSSQYGRFDSGGNFLVATTNSNPTGADVVGASIASSGEGNFSVDGAEALRLNRKSSDGEILNLRKDGATVGSIASGPFSISASGVNNTGWSFGDNSAIEPMKNSATADNLVDLGSSSKRMDDIHATNGTIQTSDENEKQDIASMTTAELAVGKRLSTLFKTFRWRDKVVEKGDKARTHSGIIAQEVKAAFEAEGLDATKYALFCSDTWTNDDGKEQTRMGVRYPELLSFVASYNESRFTAIEARIAKLEGG